MKAIRADLEGGVTLPGGFIAGAVNARVKSETQRRLDLAAIVSERPAVAAATFTTNRVKAAPVLVSQAHIRKGGDIRAIVANSGNANACTGPGGMAAAERMAGAVAGGLGLRPEQVLVCSTGRIGVPMPSARIERGIADVLGKLRPDGGPSAARAIMTSDTFPKTAGAEIRVGGKRVRIGGIAKGAGMIDPNMATMLAFITTDAVIGKKDLQRALSAVVARTFNRITVDGDMSTNDTVFALANGAAGNPALKAGGAGFDLFERALEAVALRLAWMIVEDGEAVTRFVTVRVTGAKSEADARRAAEAVANSTLIKCAWYGGDPNWGRIMDALGYSGARIDPDCVGIDYDDVPLVRGGAASGVPVARIKKVAAKKRFSVSINLNLGEAEYAVYTTDLTPAYVKFNMGE